MIHCKKVSVSKLSEDISAIQGVFCLTDHLFEEIAMWHQLTLQVCDLQTAMRAFDLLQRLNVRILAFSADQARPHGFELRVSCDFDLPLCEHDLPARMSGLVGVVSADIACSERGCSRSLDAAGHSAGTP